MKSSRKRIGNKGEGHPSLTERFAGNSVNIKNLTGVIIVNDEPGAQDITVHIVGPSETAVKIIAPKEDQGVVTIDATILRAAAAIGNVGENKSERRIMSRFAAQAVYMVTLTVPEGTNLRAEQLVGDVLASNTTLGDVYVSGWPVIAPSRKHIVKLGTVNNLEVELNDQDLDVVKVTGHKLTVNAGYRNHATVQDGDVQELILGSEMDACITYGGTSSGTTINCGSDSTIHVGTMHGEAKVGSWGGSSKITVGAGEATNITIEGMRGDFAFNGTTENVVIRDAKSSACTFHEVTKSITAEPGDFVQVTVMTGDTEEVNIDGVSLKHFGTVRSGHIRPGEGTLCTVKTLGDDVVIVDAAVMTSITGIATPPA